MKHYIEIKLFPDAEFKATTLLNALYNKLHKALFELQANDIGVSFPDYGKTLGPRLRLHGNQASLQALRQKDWIGRMKDYCQASEIQAIPEKVSYRNLSRQKDKMSSAKIRRLCARQAQGKRTNRPELTEEDINAYQEKRLNSYDKTAFLELKSSKGQKYRRHIVLGKPQDTPTTGVFDHFGLSKTATVPWF